MRAIESNQNRTTAGERFGLETVSSQLACSKTLQRYEQFAIQQHPGKVAKSQGINKIIGRIFDDGGVGWIKFDVVPG